MPHYQSTDGKSSFQVSKAATSNGSGSRMICFQFCVLSYGFSADLSDVWVYFSDVEKFIEAIQDIARRGNGQAELAALPCFSLLVSQVDRLGHFDAKFSLSSPLRRNFAQLTVNLETQSLDDLAQGLKSLLDCS
jgi:hypothetical protein